MRMPKGVGSKKTLRRTVCQGLRMKVNIWRNPVKGSSDPPAPGTLLCSSVGPSQGMGASGGLHTAGIDAGMGVNEIRVKRLGIGGAGCGEVGCVLEQVVGGKVDSASCALRLRVDIGILRDGRGSVSEFTAEIIWAAGAEPASEVEIESPTDLYDLPRILIASIWICLEAT
jgi:hypothetical protein